MHASDLPLIVSLGHGDDYWFIEMAIAENDLVSYSSLPDTFDRVCSLCGTDCGTDEYGQVPKTCINPKCAILWDFWGLRSIPRPYAFGSNSKKEHVANRTSFLRNRIQKIFNAKKLSEIPDELMFDFLLCAMIERMVHEKEH